MVKQYCLVLLQVPKHSGLVQIFLGPDRKFMYIVCQSQTFCTTPKDDFHSQIRFLYLKSFEEALNPIKFLDWLKNLYQLKTFQDLQKDKALVSPHQRIVFRYSFKSESYNTYIAEISDKLHIRRNCQFAPHLLEM